ncbi:unnamed protein product [Calicophoron daubneyi]|uniref:C2 domain-containing protein n=1 Tax=Calicophoron daubneyi TaxID=300641 RepID=A0AAV2T6Y7_CALDB
MSWEDLCRAKIVDELTQQEFFIKECPFEVRIAESGRNLFSARASKGQTVAFDETVRQEDEKATEKQAVDSIVDETEPLIADLGPRQKSRKDFVSSGRADAPSNTERADVEAGYLYYPADREAPVGLKTGGNIPRYLDEEGIYVGRTPFLALANIRRLENRIIQEAQENATKANVITIQPSLKSLAKVEQSLKKDEEELKRKIIQSWFGEDGKLAIEPNPLRIVPYRYLAWDDQFNPLPEVFQTDYIPPLSTEAMRMYFGTTTDQTGPATNRSSRFLHRRSAGVGVINAAEDCRLEVEIHELRFEFHPLYTWEHVYAQNLKQVVIAYEAEMARDQVNACIQRIRALKRALEQTKQKRQAYEMNTKPPDPILMAEYDQNIEEYQQEVSLMRRSRNHAEATQRSLLASALRAWKRVKEARQTFGCVNTPFRLEIMQEMVDETQDMAVWNQELNELVEEAEAAHNRMVEQMREAHAKEMAAYEESRRKLSEALKRQRRREKGETVQENADEETLADLEREDAKTLATVHPEKPPPLPKFDKETTRAEFEAQMKRCRRLPGEPKITVCLRESVPLTPDTNCSRSLSHNFAIDFSWNYPLRVSHQPESINAKLFEKRGWITRKIAEFHIDPPEYDQLKPAQRDARTQIEGRENDRGYKLQTIDFSTYPTETKRTNNTASLVVGHSACGVIEATDGSGSLTKPLDMHGYLVAAAFWNTHASREEIRKIDVADGKNVTYTADRPKPAFAAAAPAHVQKDLKAIEFRPDDLELRGTYEGRLDPNDPIDAQLISMTEGLTGTRLDFSFGRATSSSLRVSPATRAAGLNYFRLNHMVEEFAFCDDEELDKSRRIRLFQLREAGVPQFQNIIVPPSSRSIPADIFKEYEEDQLKQVRVNVKGMQTYRLRREQYLQKIKEQVSQRFNDALKRKTIKQMVIEEEIPNIMFIWPMIRRLFEARRPLRPSHEQRRQVAAQHVLETGLELLITIHAAYDLPARKDHKRKDLMNRKVRAAPEPIHPFVEVRFGDTVCVTSTSEGSNPSWNAELRLPFAFSKRSASLETIDDPVVISVYDEVVLKKSSDIPEGSGNNVKRIERRLLGELEIPVSTIYINGCVDGKVLLSTPLVLQGYEMQSGFKGVAKSSLHLFMTFEPAVHPPEPTITNFLSLESNEVMTHLADWYSRLEKHKLFKPRHFSALVMNSDCKDVLMTRYLHPLNPPEEFTPGAGTKLTHETVADRLARYVSLIPFKSDSSWFPGLADLWCTCDQFLNMLFGDDEEHAVLLACYFLYLEQMKPGQREQSKNNQSTSVYLCIGEAVPAGRTVFVLTHDNADQYKVSGSGWQLWDPHRGESFSVNDLHSPMRSVYGVVSMQNIWANVQTKHQPWEIEWDLSSTKAWLPLFPVRSERKKDRSKPIVEVPVLGSVQPALLQYEEIDLREVDTIKFELETALREALMEWRKTKITRINYEYVVDLTRILENLEKHNGRRYEGLSQVLDRISSKYHVYGFPMNFRYMDIEDIIARVRAKGIHELLGSEEGIEQDPLLSAGGDRTSFSSLRRLGLSPSSIQFCLAVYIKAYRGPVLSIWVYLAAIWRRSASETEK